MSVVPAGISQIIRRAKPEDIGAILLLAENARSCAQWPRASYDGFFDSEPRATELQAKRIFVACLQPTGQSSATGQAEDQQHRREAMIGFAAFSAILESGECELENMAVAAEWRRRGSGGRLLAAGQLWCRTWRPAGYGRSPETLQESEMRLEVRASNRSAIEFYERAGFRTCGKRAGYYAQPEEDALLMRQSLKGVSAFHRNLHLPVDSSGC